MIKKGETLQVEGLVGLREQDGALSTYDILGELHKHKPRLAPPSSRLWPFHLQLLWCR